jgi:hypothetical protein
MRKCAILIAGLVFAMSLAMAPAQAGIVYRYAFEQDHYQVLPGQSVQVMLLLEEDSDDQPPVSRLLAENGLAAVSALLELVLPLGPSPVILEDVVLNPAFNDLLATKPLPGTFVPAAESLLYGLVLDPILDPSGALGILPSELFADGGVWRLPLASLTFKAVAAGEALYQAAMPDMISDAMTYDALYGPTPGGPIDPIESDTVRFTVLPEPAVIGMFLPLLAFLARRRERF